MSKPPRLAVIGHPVSHSASPRMHQPALDDAGIDASYIAIDVEPGKVRETFSKMQEDGYIGCNVTVPHKLEAMETCDELTAEAKAFGATNTIIFREDGTILGHNTDGAGLSQAILEDFGKPLTELRVLILGAGGGAGRAIATQCCLEGAPAVYLSNRTIEKLEPIAIDLIDNFGGKLVVTLSTDSENLIKAASRVDLIINATSLGLKKGDPLPLPVDALRPQHLVYDAIYNPPVTPLLDAANKIGAKTSNGLSMLLHQGAFAFQSWFGITPNLKLMRDALLQK